MVAGFFDSERQGKRDVLTPPSLKSERKCIEISASSSFAIDSTQRIR
jgi:hypothetical protein